MKRLEGKPLRLEGAKDVGLVVVLVYKWDEETITPSWRERRPDLVRKFRDKQVANNSLSWICFLGDSFYELYHGIHHHLARPFWDIFFRLHRGQWQIQVNQRKKPVV